MTISTELRAARKRLGLTQGELAKRLGTNYVTIGRWERGVSPPAYPGMLRLALEALENHAASRA